MQKKSLCEFIVIFSLESVERNAPRELQGVIKNTSQYLNSEFTTSNLDLAARFWDKKQKKSHGSRMVKSSFFLSLS